jgi:hypothetical protein
MTRKRWRRKSEMAFRLDDTCGGRCEMRVSSKSDGGRFTKEGSARRNIIAVLECAEEKWVEQAGTQGSVRD